jgi:hypothetical protein
MEILHDAIGSEGGTLREGWRKWNEKSCILINISFFMITLIWIFMFVIKINTASKEEIHSELIWN